MSTATTSPRQSVSPTPKRDWLKELSKVAKPRPSGAVVYGPPGIGKSTLGASMPSPVFVIDDQEDGINTLKTAHLVPADIPIFPAASNWLDVLGILDSLATEKHEYKTLVVDSLGGMERLCHAHVCRREFNGNWGDKGFASYQKGYEVSLSDWRDFLNALDRVRHNGTAVLLLAHSVVKPFKNPEGEDYDRFVPDIHHKTWSVTHRWADMVLFCNYYVETTKEGGRTKGKGGQERLIYTEYHAAYEAKNRHGLPTEISMGTNGDEAWGNLRAALVAGRKGGEQ